MFHTVDPSDVWAWDSILSLVDAQGGYIAAHGRPVGLPRERWCQNVSPLWYAYDGVELARHVAAALRAPDGPAVVMVDELRGGSIDTIAACAAWMRENAPDLAPRWGAYIVDGPRVSYSNLQPAIDALLAANAVLAPEFYPLQSAYLAASDNPGARDQWLADYFVGAGALNNGRQLSRAARLHWLMRRRAARGSFSPVRPVFGVVDRFLDGDRPAVFLDRVMFVFLTRSGYGGLLAGCGSWKWQRPHMSNSSRDEAFRQSWLHYCRDGRRVSRLGIPAAPE